MVDHPNTCFTPAELHPPTPEAEEEPTVEEIPTPDESWTRGKLIAFCKEYDVDIGEVGARTPYKKDILRAIQEAGY